MNQPRKDAQVSKTPAAKRRIHPQVGAARGRLAVLCRDLAAGDPAIADARRDLEQAKATAYVDELLAAAPRLTDEQRNKLALLLKPVRVGAGDGVI